MSTTLLTIAILAAAGGSYAQQDAEALSRQGIQLADSDQPESARPLLKKAIELLTPPGSGAAPELSALYNSLGMIDLKASRLREGEGNLRQAVAIASAAFGEDDFQTAAWRTNLALAFVLEKQFDLAATLLNRLLGVVKTGQLRGIIYAELSAAALGQDKLSIAEDYALREIAVMEEQPVPNPVTLALARVNLGNIYTRQGESDAAEKILPAAVEQERKLPIDQRVLGDGVRRLAELRALQRDFSESAALYREAINLYERRLGRTNAELVPVRRDYAAVLKRSRKAG